MIFVIWKWHFEVCSSIRFNCRICGTKFFRKVVASILCTFNKYASHSKSLLYRNSSMILAGSSESFLLKYRKYTYCSFRIRIQTLYIWESANINTLIVTSIGSTDWGKILQLFSSYECISRILIIHSIQYVLFFKMYIRHWSASSFSILLSVVSYQNTWDAFFVCFPTNSPSYSFTCIYNPIRSTKLMLEVCATR